MLGAADAVLTCRIKFSIVEYYNDFYIVNLHTTRGF